MARKETGNTFEKGLVMDFNPISTPNNVMTSALNGTIITFNGNEYILQTDMGNGRVETAYLPAGYVPVGMVEFGGVIYVASYSPFLNRGQMGSFPSPERNISTDEMSDIQVQLTNKDFGFENTNDGASILYVQKTLYSKKLSPGDKFIVYTPIGQIKTNIENNRLFDGYIDHSNAYVRGGGYTANTPSGNPLDTKSLELYFATITDEGKIARLPRLRDYKYDDDNNKRYIIPEMADKPDGTPDVDSYRNLVESPFNLFNSKVSGELLLIAELVTIDSFSVSVICEFNDQEGADASSTLRDVAITVEMQFESDNDVYLYAVTADITDTNAEGASTKSNSYLMWEAATTVENDGEQVLDNRYDEALLTTIKGYDVEKREERSIAYTITPCMTWGPITYLARSGVIQLDKVGSGYIELYEWRYFRNSDSMLLGWALQAYPEEGYSIAGVRFIMSCLARDGKVQTIIYNVSKKNSYSGSFNETIPLGSEYFKIEAVNGDAMLLPDRLYYVTIEVQYCKGGDISDTSKFQYFYRWLYTTDVFNAEYREGKIVDFRPLQPSVEFGINSSLEANAAEAETIVSYSESMLSTIGGLSQYQYAIRQYSNKYNITGNAELVITNMDGLLKLTKDSCKMTASVTNEDIAKTISTQNVGTLGDGVAFGLEDKATIRVRENSERDPFIPVLPPEGEKPTEGELPEEWDFSSDLYQNDIHLIIPGDEFTKEGTTTIEITEGELVVETLEYAKLVAYMADNQSVQYQCLIEPCCVTEDDYLNYTLKFNSETKKFNGTILPGLNDVDAGGNNNRPRLTWTLIPENGNAGGRAPKWTSGAHTEDMSFVTKDRLSFYNETIYSKDRGQAFAVLLKHPMFALAICAAGDYDRKEQGDIGMSVSPNTNTSQWDSTSLYKDDNWWIDRNSPQKQPLANISNPIYSPSVLDNEKGKASISWTKMPKKWEALMDIGVTYVTMLRLASDHDLSVPINMFTPLTAKSMGQAQTKPYEFIHFNYMAQMLSQLYVCNNEGGVLTGVTKPVMIAYTDRIVTDFTISIKFTVDPTGFTTEILLDDGVTPEISAIINSAYRQNMWTSNHENVLNQEKDEMSTFDLIPDEENNIKFNVPNEATEVISTCLIQNVRNIQDVVNEVVQYLEGTMQTLIMNPDQTTNFSSIRGETGKVYYIVHNEGSDDYVPTVLNNGFYLYDVVFEEREKTTGEKYYVPSINPNNPDPISTTGAFNNMLVSEGKLIYLNDVNENSISVLRANRIINLSINGRDGDRKENTVWSGYSLFAPVKLLKALDKKYVPLTR